MGRSPGVLLALALAAPILLLPVSLRANDRTLPMRFALRLEGPAKTCGMHCRLFVLASGAITADTPRDFENFAQSHALTGATVVLDSDGGSVHGAIKLGREIRALGLDTTVGRLSDFDRDDDAAIRRASFSGDANCESMCAFVLLAGVHRTLSPKARVMVHQIWLGDRRSDPTAASYSAEDLVLVQRDIGKLAQYTADMGASIEVLNLALRIPPWEPMYVMSAAEIRASRVATIENEKAGAATVASSPPAAQQPTPTAQGPALRTISERRWAMIDHAGNVALARSHPLTLEGEDIGSFDLMVSCGAGNDSYDVSYSERRHSGARAALNALHSVTLNVGHGVAKLKVVSSQRRGQMDELVSFASGTVPVSLIDAFAGAAPATIR